FGGAAHDHAADHSVVFALVHAAPKSQGDAADFAVPPHSGVEPLAFGYLPRCRAKVGPMDMKAILLIGVPQPGLGASGAAPECVAGAPIASLDVLGKPLMQRVAEQL